MRRPVHRELFCDFRLNVAWFSAGNVAASEGALSGVVVAVLRCSDCRHRRSRMFVTEVHILTRRRWGQGIRDACLRSESVRAR